MITNFSFIVRLIAAWFVAFLALAILIDATPLGRFDGWPLTFLFLVTIGFVITGAVSHLRRVRLIAGQVDAGTLGQPPAPPDRDSVRGRRGLRPARRGDPRAAAHRGSRKRARQPAGARQGQAHRSLRRAAAVAPRQSAGAVRHRAQPDPGHGHARRRHRQRDADLRAGERRVERLVPRRRRHQPRERRGDHPRHHAPRRRAPPRRAGRRRADRRPRRNSPSPS